MPGRKAEDPVMMGVVMVNKAKTTIKIDRDPNFDDMKLIFDGVVWSDPQPSPYMLDPGNRVHVGSTYGNDIGLVINYNREMELAVGPNDVTDSKVWTVVSDDGGSDLTYDVQDQTAVSMTMIWHDAKS